jgi:hypothetical protein
VTSGPDSRSTITFATCASTRTAGHAQCQPARHRYTGVPDLFRRTDIVVPSPALPAPVDKRPQPPGVSPGGLACRIGEQLDQRLPDIVMQDRLVGVTGDDLPLYTACPEVRGWDRICRIVLESTRRAQPLSRPGGPTAYCSSSPCAMTLRILH